jgi:acyl carrier protein
VSDIANRVKQVIAEELGLSVADIKDDSHLVDDLGADSLDEVELTMMLEDEFEIEIPDEVARNQKTISQITEWLTANVKA